MAKKKTSRSADPVEPSEPVQSEPPDEELIEGLDDSEESSLGDYPIDTLLIRNENRTVFDVVRRIRSGGFVMNPDFQRDFIWDLEKQSRLIESVVMRIPLPVFYLAEDSQGKTIVVDGLQRLTTFRNFLDGEFKLKLSHQESLDNKRFSDLSPKIQNRIEDCNLVLYILDSKVPERAKFEIFERVNGGVALTRQQMRNCLFNGPATLWLKQEASTRLFCEATGNSLDTKKMRDREFVNRFCAFTLVGVDVYGRDMDEFLARALFIMNDSTDEKRENLSTRFRLSLKNNFDLFGRHAFRKHVPGQDHRSVVNASLWDVMSTILARYPNDLVIKRAEELKEVFYPLLKDDDFNDAITYSPNSANKVKRRFSMADKKFKEVLGDF